MKECCFALGNAPRHALQFLSARHSCQSGRFKAKFDVGFVMLALLTSLGQATAGNVTLSWNASTNVDVAGYDVHYGTASDNYTSTVNVGKVTTAAISNLTAGTTYYFSATAYDTNGDQSVFSNEARFLVPGILTLSAGSTPGSPMQIKFPVAPNHWYEVQATTDFQSWATLWQTGVATSNAWVQFSDPQAGLFNQRFYRLVLH